MARLGQVFEPPLSVGGADGHTACADAIREERRKHQHELSSLKAEYERRLRAVLDELTAPRNECKLCVQGLQGAPVAEHYAQRAALCFYVDTLGLKGVWCAASESLDSAALTDDVQPLRALLSLETLSTPQPGEHASSVRPD